MSKSLSLPAPLRCNAAFAELPLARIACSQHIHHLTSHMCQECSLAALATGQMKLTPLVLLTWNILKPQIASVGLRYHLLQSPAIFVGCMLLGRCKMKKWLGAAAQLGALADEPSQEPPHRHFLGAHGRVTWRISKHKNGYIDIIDQMWSVWRNAPQNGLSRWVESFFVLSRIEVLWSSPWPHPPRWPWPWGPAGSHPWIEPGRIWMEPESLTCSAVSNFFLETQEWAHTSNMKSDMKCI